MNALLRLVGNDGALILIHHVNKPTAAAGASTEGYSGSTAWHNSVRARWYLAPELERSDEGVQTTGALILALQKSNLGRSDQQIRLQWDDSAKIFLADAPVRHIDRQAQDTDERAAILRALRAVLLTGDYCPAASSGRRTAYHVLSASTEFPETLRGRANVPRFWRHIETLRRMGTLMEGSIRRADRKHTTTLVLKAAPSVDCANAANESGAANPA